MRFSFAILLLAACPGFAADQDFNGRWDITADTHPRPRAWWVELNGVGTPNAAGKFVSAFAGDMNPIESIKVDGGELVFTIAPPNRPGRPNNPAMGKKIYRARLAGGKLEGSAETEGQSAAPVKWTG